MSTATALSREQVWPALTAHHVAGLRDGMALHEEDEQPIVNILSVMFEGVNEAEIRQAISTRSQRSYG